MQLLTSRLSLSRLFEVHPSRILDFYLRNELHLRETDPPRPDSYYTEHFWKERLRLARIEHDQGTAVRFSFALNEAPHRVIGTINFTQIFRGPFYAGVLGYAIDEHEQGNGYMTEALREGLRFMFDELNLHRISANYLPENKASSRVLEKLGFTVEGRATDYLYIKDRWRDHVLTSLINPAWLNPFT